jgi:hypothetical protein
VFNTRSVAERESLAVEIDDGFGSFVLSPLFPPARL